MYKLQFPQGFHHGAKLQSDYYAEMDPSGRYGRFKEILGKGAMKSVYKAFDEILGVEVAWNQVKLNDVFRSPEELQRLYSEVHLLKNLDHQSIMRFYTSWIDVDRRTFNFITEMFTSGTLREYRQKYKRVDIRAIKNWARQILQGLAYLHGRDPPVIHRDLKCDNIFVNGHLGQVKIGDLGLAATLRGSQHAHSVIGTPEFMAPELYEEDYNELVDIYSFGMCLLEMLTCEYPYSECSNPAQIYKKVISGKLPEALYRIQDAKAREFVGKCLENALKRPSANELLRDPFLAPDDEDHTPRSAIPRISSNTQKPNLSESSRDHQETNSVPKNTDMTITGTINPEDDAVFLKVQISDEHGQARNIYFPFDTMSDTALDVATEMVKELEFTDWDPLEIAEMIDEEISALAPTWKLGQCNLPENLGQHSFYYDDDEDVDGNCSHPFQGLSSHSSSHLSLPGIFTSCSETPSLYDVNDVHNWSQGDFLINDDASSQSSFKYSNIHYCSCHEIDFDFISKRAEQDFSSKLHKGTRFCPEENMSQDCNKKCHHYGPKNNERAYNSNQQKIARNRSLVDVRSQLLHRSLLEEISKRRLFKTVGAVENIGYHEPREFSNKACRGDGLSGRSTRSSAGAKNRSFLW